MRRFLTFVAAHAVLLAATNSATAQSATAPAPTAAERAELDRIVTRGRLLKAYDRAAWLGTDDMLERVPDARNRVGGWVVDGPVDSPTIVFHDRARPPHALYSARLVGDKLADVTVLSGDAPTLSAERLQLVMARDTAGKAIGAAGIRPCSTSFNSVVVPPATPGAPTSVYFLSAQIKAGDMPIGGHYRVDVDGQGRAATSHAFSKGCMTLPPVPKDVREAVGVVSTLTAPLPNETHSFVVEAYHRPLVVVIPGPPQRAFALYPGQPIRPFTLPDAPASPR